MLYLKHAVLMCPHVVFNRSHLLMPIFSMAEAGGPMTSTPSD